MISEIVSKYMKKKKSLHCSSVASCFVYVFEVRRSNQCFAAPHGDKASIQVHKSPVNSNTIFLLIFLWNSLCLSHRLRWLWLSHITHFFLIPLGIFCFIWLLSGESNQHKWLWTIFRASVDVFRDYTAQVRWVIRPWPVQFKNYCVKKTRCLFKYVNKPQLTTRSTIPRPGPWAHAGIRENVHVHLCMCICASVCVRAGISG